MDENNNIVKADLSEEDLKRLLATFRLYNMAKESKQVYDSPRDLEIPKTLISYYYSVIKPNYDQMLYSFRKKYISGESLVEKNNTNPEKAGMGYVYNYIQNFDVDKDFFSIFTTSMHIHNLLYKEIDRVNDAENSIAHALALKDLEEAKKNKDLRGYRAAQMQLKLINDTSARVGGVIRKTNVRMNDFDYEVPDASLVIGLFNEYLQPDRIKEYEDLLHGDDMFAYIDYCVKTIADLIALQPFIDGNKRTFRSLLNLMFKKKNLPPVYVDEAERDAYHDALEKAIVQKDYRSLQTFYYFKLCDSIYELDFIPYYRRYFERMYNIRHNGTPELTDIFSVVSSDDETVHEIDEQTSGDEGSSRH